MKRSGKENGVSGKWECVVLLPRRGDKARPTVMWRLEAALEAFDRGATLERAETVKMLVRERFDIEFNCTWLAIRIRALEDMGTIITDKDRRRAEHRGRHRQGQG